MHEMMTPKNGWIKSFYSLNESTLRIETRDSRNMKLISSIRYANDDDDIVAYAIIEAFDGNKCKWEYLPDFDSFTWVAVLQLC